MCNNKIRFSSVIGWRLMHSHFFCQLVLVQNKAASFCLKGRTRGASLSRLEEAIITHFSLSKNRVKPSHIRSK